MWSSIHKKGNICFCSQLLKELSNPIEEKMAEQSNKHQDGEEPKGEDMKGYRGEVELQECVSICSISQKCHQVSN